MTYSFLAHDELIDALAASLDRYDPPTAQHSARVSKTSVLIGERLGLGAPELTALRWAALLHDLGKLGVDAATLTKHGPLDAAEWELIRRHPIVGADMLLDISPRLVVLATAVRSHHERWDGAGYPGGVAGTHIPLLGRIIAAADAFDAMSSARTHGRPQPLTSDEAITELEHGTGTQFDPNVVTIAVGLHHDGTLGLAASGT